MNINELKQYIEDNRSSNGKIKNQQALEVLQSFFEEENLEKTNILLKNMDLNFFGKNSISNLNNFDNFLKNKFNNITEILDWLENIGIKENQVNLDINALSDKIVTFEELLDKGLNYEQIENISGSLSEYSSLDLSLFVEKSLLMGKNPSEIRDFVERNNIQNNFNTGDRASIKEAAQETFSSAKRVMQFSINKGMEKNEITELMYLNLLSIREIPLSIHNILDLYVTDLHSEIDISPLVKNNYSLDDMYQICEFGHIHKEKLIIAAADNNMDIDSIIYLFDKIKSNRDCCLEEKNNKIGFDCSDLIERGYSEKDIDKALREGFSRGNIDFKAAAPEKIEAAAPEKIEEVIEVKEPEVEPFSKTPVEKKRGFMNRLRSAISTISNEGEPESSIDRKINKM